MARARSDSRTNTPAAAHYWPLVDWGGGPAGTLFADDQVVHGGKFSGRIERTAEMGRGRQLQR
jgi:hypothetical protein